MGKLQDEIQARRQERGDERSFMLRRLLDRDQTKTNPTAIKAFEEDLTVILGACYPDLFMVEDGALHINPNVSHAKVQAIAGALGVPQDGSVLIHADSFNPCKLNELYETDKNPLWLVLKHAVPVSQDNHSPESKIDTCIKLATAFQRGCATQAGQVANFALTKVGFNSIKAWESGVISTPDEEKAVKGAYEMFCDACNIAKAHPHCVQQVQGAFFPQEEKKAQALPSALQKARKIFQDHDVLKVQDAFRVHGSLGDWIKKGYPDFEAKLKVPVAEVAEAEAVKKSPTTVAELQDKVQGVKKTVGEALEAEARSDAKQYKATGAELEKARKQAEVFKKKPAKEEGNVFSRMFGGSKK